MWAYIVRRCAVGLALLLALTLVTFALFFASPVDPARFACGKNCSEQQRDQARKALGYDKPVYEQWGNFVKGVVVGRDFPADPELRAAAPEVVTHCEAPCLGYSHLNARTVNELVKDAAPVSISLAVVALVMWLIGGVLFGILAAVTKGSFMDRGIVGLTLVAYAFPTFFIAVFFLKYLAVKWQVMPYPAYTSIEEGGIAAWMLNLLMPSFTLALVFMAGYVRMTRAFVLESMTEDYIRTARAKGLQGRKVLFKHGLRAALTPLVTMVGLDFAALLAGAIITESVFAYPGLGLLTVQASAAYDLPTIIGVVILAGSFVILANIIVDISYAFIDPRVRLG
ncbi:ABC transporter permease [Nocardioides gansuensis]|uniref:ABC transporter permease n=1 Tax=Nocardioides gansuensis TaxID=2138300 RepID=A0A2T8FB15_9ACTN|nr:ABC transporter permease [Nocardioides gansuensis]PVG82875.1 ABC transporter permease [Nocardioides gansuensis]